jgi:hypothetical protein
VAHRGEELTLRGIRILGRVARRFGLAPRNLGLVARHFRVGERRHELVVRLLDLLLQRLRFLDLLFELSRELLELFQQLLFGVLEPFRLCHIASDLRGADDLPGLVANGRNAQRHIDASAILSNADRLEMVHTLAPQQPRDNLSLLVMQLGRNEGVYRFADDLGTVITENATGTAVPAADHAVERLADDSVIGRLHDRSEPGLRISTENTRGLVGRGMGVQSGIVCHVVANGDACLAAIVLPPRVEGSQVFTNCSGRRGVST